MLKHKFNFFPEMGIEEFTKLKESISTGFDATLGKIIIFEGAILDGWNRYQACIETNTEPVFETFTGTEQDAFEFSIRANQDRRHLNKSQLATIAIDAEPIWNTIQENVEKERIKKISEARVKAEAERKEQERLELLRKEEARKRELERVERMKLADEAEKQRIANEREAEKQRELKRIELQRIENERVEKGQLIAPSEKDQNKASSKLANMFNTNRQYINDANKLKETNPEAFEQVKSGEKTIPEVKKEIRVEELAKKKEVYDAKISKEVSNDQYVDITNTDKKFRVIYADPAWSYRDKMDKPGMIGVTNYYNTMSIEDISNMPIKNLTEKDAVLLIWVTSPLLEESFEVIKSWGFKYKSSFIWDKLKHNFGNYNSMRHEFLLVCTKGSATPDNKTLFKSVQSIERTSHSKKPIEIRDMIDSMYTHGERLELFSRKNDNPKWFVWGNEVKNND